MYLAGFSLDNLSLMALTISTGFLSKKYGISLKRQTLGCHFEDKICQFIVIWVVHTLLGLV